MTPRIAWIALALSACSASAEPTTTPGDAATDVSDGGTRSQCTPSGGHAGPCEAAEYLDDDQLCRIPLPPPDSGMRPQCTTLGDGLCYQRCASDADCTDPCAPRCVTLNLANHTDTPCGGRVQICHAASPTRSDFCTR